MTIWIECKAQLARNQFFFGFLRLPTGVPSMDTHIGILGTSVLIKNLGFNNEGNPVVRQNIHVHLINIIMVPAKCSTGSSMDFINWFEAK